MMRKSAGAFLTLTLVMGSFLCLGMGMGMGEAFAQAPAHDCCPSGAPEKDEQGLTCCLLLPAAAASTVELPSSGGWAALVPAVSDVPSSPEASGPLHETGPPGLAAGFAALSAPRAPPAA